MDVKASPRGVIMALPSGDINAGPRGGYTQVELSNNQPVGSDSAFRASPNLRGVDVDNGWILGAWNPG